MAVQEVTRTPDGTKSASSRRVAGVRGDNQDEYRIARQDDVRSLHVLNMARLRLRDKVRVAWGLPFPADGKRSRQQG
jgi:hypothetical protein